MDLGATNRSIVLENDVVVGSVNANLRHYAAAAADFRDAVTPQPDDIKVIVSLA